MSKNIEKRKNEGEGKNSLTQFYVGWKTSQISFDKNKEKKKFFRYKSNDLSLIHTHTLGAIFRANLYFFLPFLKGKEDKKVLFSSSLIFSCCLTDEKSLKDFSIAFFFSYKIFKFSFIFFHPNF